MLIVNETSLESDEEKASAFANKLKCAFNEDVNDKNDFDSLHKTEFPSRKTEKMVDDYLSENAKFKCNLAISKGELENKKKSSIIKIKAYLRYF